METNLSHINSRRLLALLALSILVGCSTQGALDQANHTARLMSLLEIQLDEFRRVQAAAERARIASLQTQKSVISAVEASAALDVQASTSAGDTVQEPLRQKVLADADGVAAIQSRVGATRLEYGQKMAALLAPLPSTKTDIAAAQAKAAAMGTELPRKVRTQELLGFATDIANSVRDNKKKVEEAKVKSAETDTAVKAAVLGDAAAVKKDAPKQ